MSISKDAGMWCNAVLILLSRFSISMLHFASPGPTSSGGTVYPVGAPIPVGLIQNLHVGPSTGAAATRAPAPSAPGGAAAAGSRGGAAASGGTPFQRQRPPVPVPMTRGVIGPLVSASESPPKSIRLNAPNSVESQYTLFFL